MTPEEIFKLYRDTHDDKAYELLQSIEKLDINYKEPKDLEILKETPNLRKLAIRNCKIDDLSIVEHLSKLKLLLVSDNRISDLSPLAELTTLGHRGTVLPCSCLMLTQSSKLLAQYPLIC